MTQINAVLPRLLKDAEKDNIASPKNSMNDASLSQKRLISLRRTKSIIERHRGLDNLQKYPKGVYIPVGRTWTLDVVDHLFREVANDIRKDRGASETGMNSLVVRPGEKPDPMPEKIRKAIEEKKITIEPTENNKALPRNAVDPAQPNRPLHQSNTSADRARVLASPDMMEALQGLTALMRSEESIDTTSIARPQAPPKIDSGSRLVSDQLPLLPPEPSNVSKEVRKRSLEQSAIVTIGGQISAGFPNDFHFVCGFLQFDILNNPLFVKLVEGYYEELVDSDNVFRSYCQGLGKDVRVRDRVPGVMARAQRYAKAKGKAGFRIWSSQQDTDEDFHRLTDANWTQSWLVEVTNNPLLLRNRLESTLRSVLMKVKARLAIQNKWSTLPANKKRNTIDLISRIEANSVEVKSTFEKERKWQATFPSSSFGSPKESTAASNGFMLCQNRIISDILAARFCAVATDYHCDTPPPPENALPSEVAKKWIGLEPSRRSVCWFDATSTTTLSRDFERFTSKIMQVTHLTKASKQPRLEVQAAARSFYTAIEQLQCPAEFFLIFITDVEPYILSRSVAPEFWFSSKGGMSRVKVAIFAKDGNCRWGSQDGFPEMKLVTVHRIPEKRWKDDVPWWSHLPIPNLPPKLPVRINTETFKILQDHLDMDGSVVAIQPGGSVAETLPLLCANHWVRSWMMQNPKHRFGIWLSLRDKDSLRRSYLKAICSLSRIEDLEGLKDLDSKTMAEDLIGLLMMMRSKAPSFQWVVVFADVTESSAIERNDWFFPHKSEWWNGRGRCIITTNEMVNLDMEMGEGQDFEIPVVLLQ